MPRYAICKQENEESCLSKSKLMVNCQSEAQILRTGGGAMGERDAWYPIVQGLRTRRHDVLGR